MIVSEQWSSSKLITSSWHWRHCRYTCSTYILCCYHYCYRQQQHLHVFFQFYQVCQIPISFNFLLGCSSKIKHIDWVFRWCLLLAQLFSNISLTITFPCPFIIIKVVICTRWCPSSSPCWRTCRRRVAWLRWTRTTSPSASLPISAPFRRDTTRCSSPTRSNPFSFKCLSHQSPSEKF